MFIVTEYAALRVSFAVFCSRIGTQLTSKWPWL